jgi:predicted DNA-binding protein with PD1-like motif
LRSLRGFRRRRIKRQRGEPKTFVLVLDTGEELLTSLKRFAKEQNLSASSFKAIGALSSVELGWFDWQTKKYKTAVKLEEQIELLSLIGDISPASRAMEDIFCTPNF